jgi:hypothetical protein
MSEPIPPFEELPELMVSLRSFGSRRRAPNEEDLLVDEQERFFAPLLDARRGAASARTRAQAVAAFDARRLTAVIDATLRSFANERQGKRTPARRAFEAELFEIVEPLRDALHLLGTFAEASGGAESPEQYAQWTLWLAQLRVVFRVADASWPALGNALKSSIAEPTPPRWRRRSDQGERR